MLNGSRNFAACLGQIDYPIGQRNCVGLEVEIGRTVEGVGLRWWTSECNVATFQASCRQCTDKSVVQQKLSCESRFETPQEFPYRPYLNKSLLGRKLVAPHVAL